MSDFHLVCLCLAALSGAAWGGGLQSDLDAVVQSHASYWNVSLTMAFGFFDDGREPPRVYAAASGTDDRFHAAAQITVDSMVPSGSADKAFTSAAIVRCAELGLLDLDDPAHMYIDPWLAGQDPPVDSLLVQWGGDDTINDVTIRQLLSMRSGVKDYNDGTLFEWTIAHPDDDYSPNLFISSVNKSFEFPPGKGGLYSGTGYVMLGMVLSAVQNVTRWDKVDQLGPLLSRSASDGGWKLTLDNTLFMMKGRCSQYPGVVHQYIDRNRPYMATAPGLPVGDAKPKMAGGACSGTQYPSTDLLGYPVASFPSTSAGACCITIGDKAGPGTYWSYDGTNCTAYSSVYKSNQRAGYTSGVTDGPFDPSNVQDLYDYSCLNGYTMGNIATTPTDVVKFYAALTTGRIVSKKSLAEMQTYEKLTAGYQRRRERRTVLGS